MTNEQLAALQAEINETQRDPDAGREHQEQPATATRTRARRTASVPSQPTTKRSTPVRSDSQSRADVGKPTTRTTAKRGAAKVAAAKPATAAKPTIKSRKPLQAGPPVRNRKAAPKVVADADPVDASDPQDKVKAPSRKAEAKRALARIVVRGIAAALADIDGLAGADEQTGSTLDAMLVRDELGVGEDMLRIASQWIHHLPTGQVDGKRYWPEGLLRPDRSDWR